MTKLLKKIKKNKIVIVISMCILFFSQFLLQYQPTRWPRLYLLISFCAFLFVFILSRFDNPNKIAWNAFIIILGIGFANTVIMPVRYNLDENTHYYHTLMVSDGQVRRQSNEMNYLMISPDFLAITKLPSKSGYGSDVNTNLYSTEFLNLTQLSSEYSNNYVSPTTLNNPAYIPAALGIVTGNIVSNRLAVSYYLGRAFNLIYFALLSFVAIKYSKKYKLGLFVFSTLPFAVWISSGYSYDSTYYGATLLIFSVLTNFFADHNKITIKQLIAYFLSCLLVVFCKAPMVLLAILPLTIPSKYYRDLKTKIFSLVGIFIIGICSFLWVFQSKLFQLMEWMPAISTANTSEVSDNSSRLTYFFEHPGYSIAVIARSLSDIPANIFGTIQRPYAYLMTSNTISLINFVFFLLFFILVSCLVEFKLPKKTRLIFIILYFIITAAVFYAISGDVRVFSVGDMHIDGVQGRYHYFLLVFMPILISSWTSNYINKEMFLLNKNQITLFVMKSSFLVLFLNTCAAMYGYL